ncbi:Ribosome-binding factor A [Novipirellula galeiformis]|uniref:Ribosome-binding factor A n=1 Tax=Novipirellula galeiformis TaxID=2528004 RepID=A0A5C6CAG9_9BACT|nr:30S ribosome-binding factor RbfA [Novipirellula galeiformis]TWU20947.1 Ribosome-binding factor A [Novipirellula galeiformis]
MSRRLLKAAEAIREVVASTILTEVRDPRIKDVTVIGVQVSPDMREAKVSVSVMGNENQQQLAIRGLQNSAGFLQSKIANRIEARYTPKLTFTLDKGLQNALVVSELLNKIKQEKTGNELPTELESGEIAEPIENTEVSEDSRSPESDSQP